MSDGILDLLEMCVLALVTSPIPLIPAVAVYEAYPSRLLAGLVAAGMAAVGYLFAWGIEKKYERLTREG